MAGLPVEDHVGLELPLRDALGGRFGGLETLEDLIRWGREQTPAVTIESVVTQDEFTHDVLVPDGDLVLAFDTS